MNIRRRHRESAEVSTESLNDIMFFLLLFFLILSTLVNPSVIKVNLPTSQNNTQIEAPRPIPLEIDKDHNMMLNRKPVTLGNLESAILTETAGMNPPSLILRFDNSLTVQDIVDILQIGAKLKVKMVLGTKAPNA